MMLAKGDTVSIGRNKQSEVRCGFVMVDGLARSSASHWRFGVGQSPQAAPRHFQLLSSSRSSSSTRVASFSCSSGYKEGFGENYFRVRLLASCLQRMNDTLVSITMSATYAVDKLLTSGMIKAMLSQIATYESALYLNDEPNFENSPCWSILLSAITRGLTHA